MDALEPLARLDMRMGDVVSVLRPTGSRKTELVRFEGIAIA
jgi:hypothetical protein